jgi:DNA-directed RNA polymerase
MLTVCRALDEGIEDFAMVHDSYGVLAGRMDTLHMGLRQAFVDIYQNDVMGDFLKEAAKGLKPEAIQRLREAMPKKGSFELESVKDSKYFFA